MRWFAGRRARPWSRADDGQVAVLVVGFVVVALALVAVVVSATQVHLERTRLAALADLAALAAADEVSDAAYYAPAGGALDASGGGATPDPGEDVGSGPGGSAGPELSDEAVEAAVGGYLARHPDLAARWERLRVLSAGSPDGRTVEVRLGVVVRPAWTAWVLAPFSDGIAVEASSSARAW